MYELTKLTLRIEAKMLAKRNFLAIQIRINDPQQTKATK